MRNDNAIMSERKIRIRHTTHHRGPLFWALTIAWIFLSAFSSRAAAAEAPVYQTRGLWVGSVEMQTPEGVDDVIRKSLAANLNTLLPLVYCGGNTYFPNNLMEMNPAIKKRFDPLAYMIDKAHRAGLEVHPWFCVMKGDEPLFRKHPDFEAVAPEREPLNPTRLGTYGIANVHNPAFRDFIVALMLECVEKYNVDGIHYDYIRAGMTSFDPESRRQFKEQFGTDLYDASKDQLNQWHGAAVEDIIKRTTTRAREIRPGVIISAAVFTKSWMYYQNAQGQDAVQWAKNRLLDVFFNMNYHNDTPMIEMAEYEISGMNPPPGSRGTGLALFMTDENGQENIKRPAPLVILQIAALKKFPIKNISLFVSGLLTDDIIIALADGPFKTKAIPAFRKPKSEK